MFRAHVLIRRSKLHYTASQPAHETATYRCDDTRGCLMQFWTADDEHMCSKHVKAWNKTYCGTKFWTSSWLNTKTIFWDFHIIGPCLTVSVWVTGNSYSCLCQPLLWDFPNHKPLPECEYGVWPVTLLDVFVNHYYEIFQIIILCLKVSVVSDLQHF